MKQEKTSKSRRKKIIFFSRNRNECKSNWNDTRTRDFSPTKTFYVATLWQMEQIGLRVYVGQSKHTERSDGLIFGGRKKKIVQRDFMKSQIRFVCGNYLG